MGKGTVYVLGTIPTYETMRDIIIPEVMGEAGIETCEADGVVIVDRQGESLEGKIIVDAMGKGGKYRVPYAACDILSGRVFESGSEIEIKPYDVLVLKK